MATTAQRIRLALWAGVCLLTFAVWSGTRPTVDGGTPAPLFPSGELRVGVDASFPPFARDNNNVLEGFDIDLANALGETLGVRVRFVTISFDALYDALVTDRVDVVISALVVNNARTQEARYTRPYFNNGMVLVSPSDRPLQEPHDLAQKRLAFEYGSEAETQARRWLKGIADIGILPYELPEYALDAVRLGIADSAIVEHTTLRLYQREHPDWQAAHFFVTKSDYAVAVRVDRLAAWDAIQNALNRLFDDGTIATLLKKWL